MLQVKTLIAAFCLTTIFSILTSAQTWNLAGNGDANVFSKLGTTNSFPVRIFVKNSEKMRVDSSGLVAIGTTTPNTSALVDMTSNNKGVLLPRMTITQRNAITTPATGLLIYQTNSTPGFYMYNGTAWAPLTPSRANTILSNLKFPTAVNVDLLADTDATKNLGSSLVRWKTLYTAGDVFINGLTIGAGNSSVPFNTAIGSAALISNTSGTSNSAIGFNTLRNNTNGYYNTATGASSLATNTTGFFNTANGAASLSFNTTGSYNTANGAASLQSNTTGVGNIANGVESLYTNTSGFSNVAIGVSALRSNTTGSNLVAVGDSALFNQNEGSGFNTAVGSKALFTNSTGSSNTATGYNSLISNTNGSLNTANGRSALFSNTTGSFNTANGANALFFNTTGSFNTANGANALLSNTTGSNNTANGISALYNNTTGSLNTAIGNGANVSANNLTNATAIGSQAVVNASDKIRIGNSGTTCENATGSWTASDGRFKYDVKEEVKGLEFINALRPVVYNFDATKFEGFLRQNFPAELKEKELIQMKGLLQKATAIRQTGFIAQEVEEAAKKTGYNFNGVHHPDTKEDNYSLSYEKFVVPLVKAVQELSSQNSKLKMQNEEIGLKAAKVDEMQNQLQNLQKQIDELKAALLQVMAQKSPCTTSK